MKVIAIKPAFFNGQRVRLGEEIEIPDSTKGNWFAPPGHAQAQAAQKIKASAFVPANVGEMLARGRPVDLTESAAATPRTLHALSRMR